MAGHEVMHGAAARLGRQRYTGVGLVDERLPGSRGRQWEFGELLVLSLAAVADGESDAGTDRTAGFLDVVTSALLFVAEDLGAGKALERVGDVTNVMEQSEQRRAGGAEERPIDGHILIN